MIYLDHNAGAPLLPEVATVLASERSSGNPSSVHRAGREARSRLDAARDRCAELLKSSPREIVFTGSGSEAAALAIKGSFGARKDLAKTVVVTSTIEHPCVLGAVSQLERAGAIIRRIAPLASGLVPFESLRSALAPEVALCTVMAVNNETGVIQPVAELGRECAARGILFHCDAVQAAGRIDLSNAALSADLVSLSAHKLGGPPGIGLLRVRRGIRLEPLTPGHQEFGHRGGTPNAVLAQALALALEHALAVQASVAARLSSLRHRFESEAKLLGGVSVNGERVARVSNTSNLEFAGLDGEALLIALDLEGICASSGAACASGSLSPSHVLTAMGLSSAQAQASMRFSFGESTTAEEIEACLDSLRRHVPRLRAVGV